MRGIKRIIVNLLNEVYGKDAYGVHELIKSSKELRLMDISLDAKGAVVSWYRSEQDGKLYEIVISPMKAAVYGVPEHLKPKQNTSEPYSAEEVKHHIETSMHPFIYGVNIADDSERYYDFTLIFDRRVIDKDKFIATLKQKTMVVPYTFKLMPNDRPERVSLRYVKS